MHLAEAALILFEDHTDTSFALHSSPESFDLLLAELSPSRERVLFIRTGTRRAISDIGVSLVNIDPCRESSELSPL